MEKTVLRINRILDELNKQGRLTVQDIQNLLNVSPSTVRRLCIDLESQQKAVRVLGGLQKLPAKDEDNQPGYSYDQMAVTNVAEKQRIGAYASTLVQDGDIIYVTGGTTVFQLVLSLKKMIQAQKLHGVVIITNSIANAEALADTTRVLLTGGEYRPERRDVAGYMSELNIKSAHFNKCFIGVDGIDLANGLMALDIDTANMDHLVTSQSSVSYILADHTKFKKQSFIMYERFSSRHVLITDDGADEPLRHQAKAAGLEIVYA